MFDPQPLAERLLSARRPGDALAGMPDHGSPTTVMEAYAVQDALVTLLATQHGEPAGYKIGCTNAGARALLQVDHPFMGRCFKNGIVSSPTQIRASEMHMTGIEPEIALRIGTDMPTKTTPWNTQEAVEHVAQIMPAIEVVESRFSTWPAVGPLGAIADNGVHRVLIVGPATSDWTRESVDQATVLLQSNGTEADSGTADNVDGGPFGALAWLANHLNNRGRQLQTGDIVTTGVMCKIYNGQAGEQLIAHYGDLGEIQLTIE